MVTEVDGTTSHAALVCREIGVPCFVGCGDNAPDPYLHELLSYLDHVGVSDHPLAEYVQRRTVTGGAT